MSHGVHAVQHEVEHRSNATSTVAGVPPNDLNKKINC